MTVAPNLSNISGRKVCDGVFVLFSVTLKPSSASSVLNNFTWLLLLYKQRSIALSWQIEKKKNGFIY